MNSQNRHQMVTSCLSVTARVSVTDTISGPAAFDKQWPSIAASEAVSGFVSVMYRVTEKALKTDWQWLSTWGGLRECSFFCWLFRSVWCPQHISRTVAIARQVPCVSQRAVCHELYSNKLCVIECFFIYVFRDGLLWHFICCERWYIGIYFCRLSMT